jgi:hypothetical protein
MSTRGIRRLALVVPFVVPKVGAAGAAFSSSWGVC